MNKEKLDISVIIPFKDKSKMTAQCVHSLLKFGPEFKEVLLINNGSSVNELKNLKESVKKYQNVVVLDYNAPFNYQKMNNWAVSKSSGSYIFFLNNDTELVAGSREVIEHMYRLAAKENIGMVGCVLLYGDRRTIQHAGVYLRPGSLGDHIYVGSMYKEALKKGGSEDFPYKANEDRPVTAVTGAAQIVEKKKFEAVLGFDDNFIICGGDVDLCIRLNKAGYQTWISGKGFIVHKESQSRSYKPIPYQDFYYSYLSYLKGFDLKVGDPYSPKITENMK
jgi:GT2 family glycosyltransferase